MRKSISVSLPETLKRELDEVVRAEGTTRSDVIREAVREHLVARRMQALRRELVPYAEARGVFTDEDVFRTVS